MKDYERLNDLLDKALSHLRTSPLNDFAIYKAVQHISQVKAALANINAEIEDEFQARAEEMEAKAEVNMENYLEDNGHDALLHYSQGS